MAMVALVLLSYQFLFCLRFINGYCCISFVKDTGKIKFKKAGI